VNTPRVIHGPPAGIIRLPRQGVPPTPADDLGEATRAHRRYKLASGEIVPNVSTVAHQLDKPQLILWANRLGLQGIDSTLYRDEAGNIGKAVHEMVAAHFANRNPVLERFSKDQLDRAYIAMDAFYAWAKTHTLVTEMSEEPLVSERYRYGGTVDWVGLYDARRVQIDFKSANAIYPEHRTQVSGYTGLLAERGVQIEEAHLLRIGRDPIEGFADHTLTLEELRRRFVMFLRLLDVFRLRKELGDNK
jgi:hypothetical protein